MTDEAEGAAALPGPSQPPPPYTISDGAHPPQHPSKPLHPQPLPPTGLYTPGHYPSAPYGHLPAGGYLPPGSQPPPVGFSNYGCGYPPYGAPHYNQSGHGPYYPPQQQQQQQQTVVMMGGMGVSPSVHPPVVIPQSFVGQIFLAVFVYFCCGIIFGGVALVLAIIASNHSHSQPETARAYGRASIWVSGSGIVVGVAIIIITASVMATMINNNSKYYYY